VRKADFDLLRQDRGSSAVEFALVLPAVAILLFAIINLCYLVYAAAGLHWAVEQAARCAAISQKNTGLSCQTKSQTQTYASAIYRGPAISPTFTAVEDTTNSNAPCRKVSGSGSYLLRFGVMNLSVPLDAKACFPEANTGVAWS
jgi:Flp pilus assembly protein TadG